MKKMILMAALMIAACLGAKAQTQQDATCGQTVRLTATPEPGYKFVQWNDGNTENPRNITINGEDFSEVTTYVASFTEDDFTIVCNVNDSEMGHVEGAGTFTFGQTTTITAIPSSKCYKFKQWSDGNTNASRQIVVGATAEANTYTAEFEMVTFKVNVSADNATHGTVKIELASL